MLFPIRDQIENRINEVILVLDRPLSDGDDILVRKTEESQLGMSDYSNSGFVFETLAIGKGKSASELSITVHFPKGLRPLNVRDSSEQYPREKEKLSQEAGQQIITGEAQFFDTKDGGTKVVSKAKLDNKIDERRFIQVVYYKKG